MLLAMPKVAGQWLDQEFTTELQYNRCDNGHQQSFQPGVRAPEPLQTPLALANPRRYPKEHEEDRHFVRDNVEDIMANHDRCPEHNFEERNPTIAACEPGFGRK